MKLKICKKNFSKYSRAKTITASKNFLVTCSGKTVSIYDKQLNFLKQFDNLSYVYTAKISPNEKKLLLISNTNKFYLVDLVDFSISKYATYGDYNCNLEGRGCWETDDVFFLLVENKTTHKSALRKYDIRDEVFHVDLFSQKYRLFAISFIPTISTIVILGHDIEKAMRDQDDSYRLILFDGQVFSDYTLETIGEDVFSFDYNEATKALTIYGFCKTWYCDLSGKKINSILTPNSSINSLLNKKSINSTALNCIESLAKILGLEFLDIEEYITKVVLSFDDDFYFIGTNEALYVINKNNNMVEDSLSIECGVTDILQFSDNMLFVSTFNGLVTYELVENL